MSVRKGVIIISILLCLLLIPSYVSAGYLKTGAVPVSFNVYQSTETDIITLVTENGYVIDLQFIALNPAGQPMPIESVIGFNTRIEENTDGFKWSYDLNLPNPSFVAKVKVTSPIPIEIVADKYIVIDGSLISFDDVLDYDYSYVLNPLDDYSAEYEITKDYGSYGISQGDAIIIDPTILSFPTNDGYLTRDNLGSITVDISSADLYAGYEANEAFRTYIRFDTQEIDSFDTIINATLTIFMDKNDADAGDECYAQIYKIPDFGDLGVSDWNTSKTAINLSWIYSDEQEDEFYTQLTTNYIEKEGYTAYHIRTALELYDGDRCRFIFDSNETINSPSLEIYWDDGTPNQTISTFPNFNISSPESNQVYAEQGCLAGLTAAYDPKIACEVDGDSCVAVFYEHNFFCGRGMKYALSYDDFQTIAFIGQLDNTAFSDPIIINPYNTYGHKLPYDIAFYDFDQHYYFVRNKNVYVMPVFDPQVLGVTPYRFTDGYTLADGRVIGEDMVLDCCTEVNYQCAGSPCQCASQQRVESVKFYDNNATMLWGTFQGQAQRTVPTTDQDGWFGTFTYDVTNTTTTGNGNLYDCTQLSNYPACSAAAGFGQDFYSVFAEFDGVSTWRYVIEAQLDYCTGSLDKPEQHDNFASPQKYFNHFWFGSNLYFRNSTEKTMVSSESTDLVTFGTSQIRYYESAPINEIINQSDAATGATTNYYIFSRDSTQTDGSNGIWVQTEQTYPVLISSTDSVTAILECQAQSYTVSDSGRIFQLTTPCLTGNKITFISSKAPNIGTIDFDIDSCNSVTFSLNYANSPYDFVFTVKDALTSENLQGADFSLTGETSQTTNSNGQAIFNINPISSPSFKDYITDSGCTHTLSTEGTPQTLFGEVTLTGYVDNAFSIQPATKTSGDINTWAFDDNDLVTLYPDGVVLNVRAYTSDGQEIVTSSYNVSVTGNNNLTYTFVNNNPSLRNFNLNTPATFLLYDNRTTYNVTVTIDYITGTQSQELEVTVNEQYPVYFYLPFTFLDLPCQQAEDCVKDFCGSDGFHNRLSGCVNNVCEYETTDCQTSALCDADSGCFQISTSIPCNNDNTCLFDSNVTYCIDDITSYSGFCGTDGFCKAKEKTCATFCNETLGYCNEGAACLIGKNIRIGYQLPSVGVPSPQFPFTCSLDKAGESQCFQFGVITDAQLTQLGISITDVYFTHSDFLTRRVTDGWEIGSVVAKCSDTCDIELEFCSSGQCSAETNTCLKSSSSNIMKNVVGGGWEWIAGIIPLELRLLFWIVFTIVAMVVYKQATGKHGKDNDRTTLIVGASVFFIGIGLGWVHWIFLLIIGTIISFMLWKNLR